MVIEHNGARLVIKPACVEDLSREGEEGDKRRLFVAFDFGDNEVLRRAYVPNKQTEPPLFLAKVGGEFVDLSTLEHYVWCDSEGYEI